MDFRTSSEMVILCAIMEWGSTCNIKASFSGDFRGFTGRIV